MNELWLFFLLVAGVVLLPGLDMAFVLASSIGSGRRAGLFAVAGIMAGGTCHTISGVLGIAFVLKLMPSAFNAVLIAGALYVAWIGWSLIHGGISLPTDVDERPASSFATFRGGALTNLLNPKAYLFMLAVFPRFLHREAGAIWIQGLKMGVIVVLTQAVIYGAVALLGSAARSWLTKSPGLLTVVSRTVGAMLIVAAFATGVEGWRSLA